MFATNLGLDKTESMNTQVSAARTHLLSYSCDACSPASRGLFDDSGVAASSVILEYALFVCSSMLSCDIPSVVAISRLQRSHKLQLVLAVRACLSNRRYGLNRDTLTVRSM